MGVTSRESVDFPKLGWSIRASETRALPEDKEAQTCILAESGTSWNDYLHMIRRGYHI